MHVGNAIYKLYDLKNTNIEKIVKSLKETEGILYFGIKSFISDKIDLLTNEDEKIACIKECKKACLLAIQKIGLERNFFKHDGEVSKLINESAIELFNALINKDTSLGQALQAVCNIKLSNWVTSSALNYFDSTMELKALIDLVEDDLLYLFEKPPASLPLVH